MNLHAGIFLQSTELLNDTVFEQATVFIAEYNEKGALGFVVGRRFGRALNELVEFRHSPAFNLYEGGPVDEEHLFFLHRRPEVVDGGTHVSDGIYLGGDFKQVVQGVNNKTLTEKDVAIFVGYCGWDAGDLEAEIEEGSWVLAEGNIEALFGTAV